MKNIETNYIVSKNYNLLHDLIEMGLTLVCFVDYSYYKDTKIYRDIAYISIQSNTYKVSARGIGYNDERQAPNKEHFLKMCRNLNLAFIEPTRIALSLDSCSSCENISDVECECIKNDK